MLTTADTPVEGLDDLDRVLKLFLTHSDDAELHVRHTAALDKLCRSASNGFAIQSLPQITEILGCILDLVQSKHCSVFLEPACNLVRAVGRPYVKQSSTDELRVLGTVSCLLRTLCRIFLQRFPCQLQACTAEVLEDFASVWGNRPAAPIPTGQSLAELDLQSVQRTYQLHQSLLHDSELVPAICSTLQQTLSSSTARPCCSSSKAGTAAGDSSKQQQPHLELQRQLRPPESATEESLAATLVSTLLEFSYSPKLCQQQLQAGILPVLAQLLLPAAVAGMSSKMATQVMETLWNLFDLAPEAANAAAASSCPEPSGLAAGAQPQHEAQQQVTNKDSCANGEQQQQQPEDPKQAEQSAPQQLVQALAVALRQQMATCNCLQRQQQRNDTLTVLYLISKCSNFVPALAASSSLLQQLLAAAHTPALTGTAARAGSTAPCNSSATLISGSSLEADHSMQLLAWSILGNAAVLSQQCTEAVLQAELLRLLLDAVAFGVADCSSNTEAAWFGRLTPEQLSASKQLAWSTLQQVAPLCKADFITCGGVSTLLSILTACSTSSSAGSGSPAWLTTGSAMAASIGRSSPAAGHRSSEAGSCGSAEPVLRLLRCQLCGNASLAAAVVAHNGARVLLQLLQAPAAAALTAVRQGVLLCLSELCIAAGRACMSAVRDAGGVGCLLRECQSILDGDPYVPSLAALDALWRCCIHSNHSRAQLLAADGMDTLLGLLQRGNPALQPVLLSMLADLLADNRSHSFFWEWHAPAAASSSGWSSSSSSFSPPRSRPVSGSGAAAAGALNSSSLPIKAGSINGSSCQTDSWLLTCCGKSAANGLPSGRITSAQLLIAVWRQQDQALGVTGPDGLLASVGQPLSGCGRGGNKRPAARVNSIDSTGSGGAAHVDAYGLMLPGRQLVLERLAQAGSPYSLMEKVFACFAALGIGGSKDSSRVSPDGLQALQQLPATDAATLVVIQQYKAFRQGEVWQGIHADFDGAGLQLTEEDRMRLESGIQHAEMVTAQVQAMQATLLEAALVQQLAAERVVYDNMASQAAADAKAKVYEKDCSKLTMRERLAAKARKEDMLQRSCPAGGFANSSMGMP